MTPETRKKLFNELMTKLTSEPVSALVLQDVINRLLDEIDVRDEKINNLASALERVDDISKKVAIVSDQNFKSLSENVSALMALVREYNENLLEIFDAVLEGERILFDGESGVMKTEIVSKWYHEIRQAFYNVLNPVAPLSLSAADGKFTAAGETPGATTQL